MSDDDIIVVKILPARRAKGSLSSAKWAHSRASMRDKGHRVRDNQKLATKKLANPSTPGSKR
ncbi:hypothetical protein [Rhodopila sp.]|uniref:hypothetical protein n=1 Tax=Rhodopila sp. TaxID=2480087 RepID=UPI003D0B1DA7